MEKGSFFFVVVGVRGGNRSFPSFLFFFLFFLNSSGKARGGVLLPGKRVEAAGVCMMQHLFR